VVEVVMDAVKLVHMLQMKKGDKWIDVARLVSKEDMVGAKDVVKSGYSDMGKGVYRIRVIGIGK
jgi:hypothetical protein